MARASAMRQSLPPRTPPCAPSVTRRFAPSATSPALFGAVEARSRAIPLLHRRADDGGGGSARYQRDETEGAQGGVNGRSQPLQPRQQPFVHLARAFLL